MDTLATGTCDTETGTVAVAVAAEKPVVAGANAVTVSVAVPGLTAVTIPAALIIATFGALVPKLRVDTGAPLGWATETANVWVPPTVSATVLGIIDTPVIAAGRG
jgi:hypothetical protein